MDVVGGFVLADGRRAKALTGIDDHSRFCVSAYLTLRETAQRVCDGLALAMRTYGVPEEILTDNGKVFTGRFNRPPVEVLFDRVCRENGIAHRLTQPRSPTTTGKVERFHRTLRAEFRTDRVFTDLASAQAELDEWVGEYNHPTSTLGDRDGATGRTVLPARGARPDPHAGAEEPDRAGGDWVARRAGANGVISVSWQQICLGKAAAGHPVDVHVTDRVIQVWDGNQLLKTVARTSPAGRCARRRPRSPGSSRSRFNHRVSTRNRTPQVKQEPEPFRPTQPLRGQPPVCGSPGGSGRARCHESANAALTRVDDPAIVLGAGTSTGRA